MPVLLRSFALVCWALIAHAMLSVPLTIPAHAEDAASFAHKQIDQEAANYAEYLERFKPKSGKTKLNVFLNNGASLIAKDPRGAARSFAVAVAIDPQSSPAWLGLANALLAYDPATYEGSERYNVPVNASGAAYRAYQKAATPAAKAESLAVLTEALVRRSFWRPAIEALKASLALQPDAALRQRLTALKAEHGFRMTTYNTQSDTSEPRICLEFSEQLSSKQADFSDFISVGGKDPQSVTLEGQSLCIGGLQHGERYEIELREGLPSDIADEKLEKTVPIAAYVPDRKPSVRFTGRSYVLPSRGQQGIPLVSVNTDSVNVEVFRIGDRALAGQLEDGDFARQLSTWDVNSIKERRGEKVYDGTLTTGQKLNAEVTTAFPVSDALGTLKPGVYAMTAKPTKPTGEDSYQIATQWFIVSDLGLTALNGDDGIHAFIRSLDTATPVAGTEVRLVARNNEVLATAKSDDKGHVLFEKALARGEGGLQPAILVAQNGATDYAFLDLATAAFDLTDRGVAGRDPTGPIDAFVYTERGVYRPGEVIHLTALVRDDAGRASSLPVTLVMTRPDGVEHRRLTLKDGGLGGRTSLVTLSGGAMTGTWRARIHVDPKSPAVAETAFLVEDFVPERLDMKLAAKSEILKIGETAEIEADGRFLYGPPAADLALEGEIVVRPASGGVPGYSGFRFGQADELITPTRAQLAGLPRTDAQGHAVIVAQLPKVAETAQPLEAQLIVRLAEPGGRTIERSTTLPVDLGVERVGIKPVFENDRLDEGQSARFEVVRLGPDGKPKHATGLNWTLKRVDTRWQWYTRDGSWNYEAVTVSRQIATGELTGDASGPAKIETAVDYGRYVLEVATAEADGAASSYAFNAGWFASADKPDSPEVLDVALDKASYRPGDTAKLRIATRLGGRALVAILGSRLHAMQEVEIPNGGGSVDIPVGDDWGPGAYATALLYRPMEASAKRMPQRALGLTWVGLDQSTRELKISLDQPGKIKSGTRLEVPVSLEGLAAGEPARVTLAAVDLGILNLTRFKTPAPERWFNAQTKLGTEIRDYYGRLIDGMRAERGALRSGGDADQMQTQGTPPVEATVAEFSGIVEVGPDGKVTVGFDLPEFNGTLRLMAVAWSKDKVGHASGDVFVRDAVALTVAAPRFLTLGDEVDLGFDIHNVEGPNGTYKVGLTQSAEGAPGKAVASRDVALEAGQRVREIVKLTADTLGLQAYRVTVEGPDGISVGRDLKIDVKAPAGDIRRTTVATLKAGGSIEISPDLVADLIPERTELSVSVGPAARFDAAGMIASLDRYPYGCTEQTISKALPLVYADLVATRTGISMDPEVKERVQKAIDRVFEMQDSSGAFGSWGPSATNMWLTAYAADFMTRAREAGYRVDPRGYDQALDRLANFIAYAQDFESGGGDRAYALYVLARNGRAPMGELRYYADARLNRFSTPIAKAQLGAALGLMGERQRATTAISAAANDLMGTPAVSTADYRDDYGSWLRDGAALLALSSETSIKPASTDGLADRVSAAALSDRYTSTQEQAWLLLAVKALGDSDATSALRIGSNTYKAPLNRTMSALQVKSNPITIHNEAAEDTTAVISITGAATMPEPPASEGFKIERAYYTLDGAALDLQSANGGKSAVKQNERFIVVVKVTADKAGGRVLVADRLPAGFEVENPRLVSSGDLSSLSWLKTDIGAEHTEFRDDRVVAAFNLFDATNKDSQTVSIAYMVRAVTPGSFVHPAAVVEDMYVPERHARTAAGRLSVETN
ncbi:MAG: alpha-2-macroglobulin family protein [Alphaproteobacteria bacterium]|nr:alpha-2-macroglobulin family protein [Alphaproteobacteria bacterium]